MKPIVIAIVGMPGSGKGTTVTYLSEAYRLPNIHFGSMVYDEIRSRGLDIVMDEQYVREDMRTQEGPNVLAKRAAAKARELLASGKEAIVLDGVYSWSEDKYLRHEFGHDYIAVACVNPKQIRYERAVTRKDAHRPYTLEQIRLRDLQEIDHLEKGGPIAYADYYLANARNVNELRDQIVALMENLGFTH